MNNFFFLYGPPGSGKSTVGRLLARDLSLPFCDLDGDIEVAAGRPVAEIFAAGGEAGFRSLEAQRLAARLSGAPGVIALGGGTLLDGCSRSRVEAAGPVVCLNAAAESLHSRLQSKAGVRPLLGNAGEMEARLHGLLAQRARHYASFALQVDTSYLTAAQAARQAQVRLGAFRVRGMGAAYEVRVRPGGLADLGERMSQAGLKAPVVLVSDANTGPLYAAAAAASLEGAGFYASQVCIPGGEENKTVATLQALWKSFLGAGLERSGTVVALGGGVVGDLAGYAAAAFLRGVRWVNVPTSLLAMVDASLGGKTGADLPQGKNLVGAFHPPSLVLADPALLASLPQAELCNGLGEVVKNSVAGDASLFEACAAGWEVVSQDWDRLIRQAMAVKIHFIQADPYEKGLRAALNLGHTLGHALESVSGYRLRHGEAVSIGMVAEARLAERIGLARPGLAETIESVLSGLRLPVQIPANIDRASLYTAMQFDKKKAGGSLHFALPQRIGRVKTGINVSGEDIQWMLESSSGLFPIIE